MSPSEVIASPAQLRERYAKPLPLVVRKQLAALDGHCRAFIARSPLVMVATADAQGGCDVSPRGDPPGFVAVLDDGHLAIPDRKGNNRLDALGNVLANPRVGLLFVVPGSDDTLRVNGRASIVADPELLAAMAVEGRVPASALLVEVEEAFLHCGRAFKRGRVWDPTRFVAPGELPTLGRILTDQTAPDAQERRLIAQAPHEGLY
jgi:PPOX class probable FMN-dependent enzyme